jgi:hypothetical protein
VDLFTELRREDQLKFLAWLSIGQKNGWVDEVFCAMHDSPELTEAEIALFDSGTVPCIAAVRLAPMAYYGENAEPGLTDLRDIEGKPE